MCQAEQKSHWYTVSSLPDSRRRSSAASAAARWVGKDVLAIPSARQWFLMVKGRLPAPESRVLCRFAAASGHQMIVPRRVRPEWP